MEITKITTTLYAAICLIIIVSTLVSTNQKLDKVINNMKVKRPLKSVTHKKTHKLYTGPSHWLDSANSISRFKRIECILEYLSRNEKPNYTKCNKFLYFPLL